MGDDDGNAEDGDDDEEKPVGSDGERIGDDETEAAGGEEGDQGGPAWLWVGMVVVGG